MISREDRIKLRNHYLRHYNTTFTKAELEIFRQELKFETSYIEGDNLFLKKVACFFLLDFGKQIYRAVNSYEIVESHFGHGEELDESANIWYDTTTPLLIVHHFKETPDNKLLYSLIGYNVRRRDFLDKMTLVLSEVEIREDKDTGEYLTSIFKNLNKQIFEESQFKKLLNPPEEM